MTNEELADETLDLVEEATAGKFSHRKVFTEILLRQFRKIEPQIFKLYEVIGDEENDTFHRAYYFNPVTATAVKQEWAQKGDASMYERAAIYVNGAVRLLVEPSGPTVTDPQRRKMLRMRALEKLTAEEREALDLAPEKDE